MAVTNKQLVGAFEQGKAAGQAVAPGQAVGRLEQVQGRLAELNVDEAVSDVQELVIARDQGEKHGLFQVLGLNCFGGKGGA